MNNENPPSHHQLILYIIKREVQISFYPKISKYLQGMPL